MVALMTSPTHLALLVEFEVGTVAVEFGFFLDVIFEAFVLCLRLLWNRK